MSSINTVKNISNESFDIHDKRIDDIGGISYFQPKSIVDEGNYFTNNTVEDALQELGENIQKYHKSNEELIAEFDEEITIASLEGQAARLLDNMIGTSITAAEATKLNTWLNAGKPIPLDSAPHTDLLYQGSDGALYGKFVKMSIYIPSGGGQITQEGSDQSIWLATEGFVDSCIQGLQTEDILDTGNYFTTDTVNGALQQLGSQYKVLEIIDAALHFANLYHDFTPDDRKDYIINNVSQLNVILSNDKIGTEYYDFWIELNTTKATPTITFTRSNNGSLYWLGDAPQFGPLEKWVIHIKNDTIECKKATLISNSQPNE